MSQLSFRAREREAERDVFSGLGKRSETYSYVKGRIERTCMTKVLVIECDLLTYVKGRIERTCMTKVLVIECDLLTLKMYVYKKLEDTKLNYPRLIKNTYGEEFVYTRCQENY
jgi:hypothetical protein